MGFSGVFGVRDAAATLEQYLILFIIARYGRSVGAHDNLQTAALSLMKFCTNVRLCILYIRLLNIKVISQMSKQHTGFCAFLYARYPRVVPSLERGFYLLLAVVIVSNHLQT